jgi:hypothetical protein
MTWQLLGDNMDNEKEMVWMACMLRYNLLWGLTLKLGNTLCVSMGIAKNLE